MDIKEKIKKDNINKRKFLGKLYEKTQGRIKETSNMWEIGEELGFEKNQTSDIVDQLDAMDYLRHEDGLGIINLTFIGKIKYEDIYTKAQEKPLNTRPNKKLKIFLSHSSLDYDLVNQIKKGLESIGLEVFLAHKDIRPSTPWQKEIEQKLKECNIFILVLTKNFKGSDWADQEVGIAYALKKHFISLIVEEITPYGFIGKWHGFRLKSDESSLPNEINKLIKHIQEDFPKQVKENILSFLENIKEYNHANITFKILDSYRPFEDKEINYIFEKSILNPQIYQAYNSKSYLETWIEEEGEKLKEDLYKSSREKLNSLT